MSTKVKDSLHELIHSLSKSEKRYYKVYTTRHSSSDDSNMVVLFDFISRQAQYNEAKLFEHFSGKAFLNQFSTVKKRLYDHILQALHAFHSGASVEAQANRMLHQAQLLFRKSLYDQSLRHLRSAERLAAKNELFVVLLQVNKLKQELLETRGAVADGESLEKLQTSSDLLFAKEQLIQRLSLLKGRLFRELRQIGVATTAAHHAAIDRIFKELPAHSDLQAASSAEAWYLYFHLHAAYSFAKGDLSESLAFTEQTIQHLQQQPAFSDDKPTLLLSAYTNACYLAETLGRDELSARYLSQLKMLEQHPMAGASEDLQLRFFTSISSIELSLLIVRGQFDEARQLVPGVLAQLEQFRFQVNPARRAFLLLKLAIVETGSGRPSQALKHINNLLNDPLMESQEEIIATAYLLNAVLHFELANYDHVHYALKMAQRELKGMQRLGAFEQLFLSGLAKIARLHVVDFSDGFSQLLAQLSEAEQQPVTPNRHFDFVTWVEAMIRKVPFAKAVAEKGRFLKSA